MNLFRAWRHRPARKSKEKKIRALKMIEEIKSSDVLLIRREGGGAVTGGEGREDQTTVHYGTRI